MARHPVWAGLAVVVAAAWAGMAGAVVPGVCPNKVTNRCYFSDVAKLMPDVNNARYYAVGGLFSIRERGDNAFSCSSKFKHSGVLLSQAFLWSLNYWQQRTSTVVSVGGVVFDTCDREEQMTQYLLGFEQCNLRIESIDRHDLVGFVGTCNADGEAAASLTKDMDLTVISPLASSVMLSDHDSFPYYLRTTPSLQVDVDIMAELLGRAGVKYVAAFYQKSEMATFQAFKMTVEKKSICITASFAMEDDLSDDGMVGFVNTSLVDQEKTRFVALFMSDGFLVRFMRKASADKDVKIMNLIFLIPSSIKNTSAFFDGSNSEAAKNAIFLEQQDPKDPQNPAAIDDAVQDFKQYWEGVITGAGTPAGLQINNAFLSTYLNTTNANSIPRDDPYLASTIMAVQAFVKGVSSAGRVVCQNNINYLCRSFFNDLNRGSTINQYIRSSTNYFTAQTQDRSYVNGDLRSSMIRYKIYRYRLTGSLDQLGTYSNGRLTLDVTLGALGAYYPGECPDRPCLVCGEEPPTTPAPATTTQAPKPCKPEDGGDGNFSVVYYPPNQEITGAYMQNRRRDEEFETRFEVGQRWIIALGVLAGLGILSVLVFEIYILYKLLGTRMGHKWRTMWLGQLLLFGIFLCYLTLFAYLLIPTKATCGITRFGVGVSYSICFAVLLVKLMVILTSKTSESSLLPGDVESPNYLKGVYQFLMFVFVVGVQVVIDAQWLITVPPEAVKVTANHGGEVWVCNHYTFKASGSISAMTDMSSFVRNEFENHVLSLVYIMFLILITTLLALNAHGIITNHRESVFIGIAAGFSIPLWLAWTLVGGLNRDHEYAHEFGDACIAFGLFLTATLILFAMFLPKVRQLVSMGVEGIYFEDDRDTVYAGSVIMAPPSYKSRPNSVIYVNNQGIYSEPVVIGNGESTYMRHPGSTAQTPASTYSAPPTYLKRGADSTLRGGSVLRVTDDLSGRRPLDKKRPMSEVAYGTAGRRSHKGTLPRTRSYNSLGAL